MGCEYSKTDATFLATCFRESDVISTKIIFYILFLVPSFHTLGTPTPSKLVLYTII